MANSLIFLIASSRINGNTWKILNHINQFYQAKVINLSQLNISYYDYQHKNVNDDFISTIEEILNYQIIGFVSPVYWYTVSAQMKVFMDRFSDLLSVRKDLGRSLANKKTFLLANGSAEIIPEGMIETIKLTSDYLSLNFQGASYCQVIDEQEFDLSETKQLKSFINNILKT